MCWRSYRYVELNPVRAGMVDHPADYPWSSYAANGQGDPCPFITPHPLYQALGELPEQRRSRYRGLFAHHMDPGLIDEIRDATNGGFVLGSERFQREIEAVVKRRVVRGTAGRPSRGVDVASGDLFD